MISGVSRDYKPTSDKEVNIIILLKNMKMKILKFSRLFQTNG